MKADEEISSSLDTVRRPSNPASSNDAQQQIEAIKDNVQLVKNWVKEIQKQVDDEEIELKVQVVELKEQVKVMSPHVERLNASGWKSRQGQWDGSTSGPSTGATPWSEGSTSGPSAAAQH